MKAPTYKQLEAIRRFPDVDSVEWTDGELIVVLKPIYGKYATTFASAMNPKKRVYKLLFSDRLPTGDCTRGNPFHAQTDDFLGKARGGWWSPCIQGYPLDYMLKYLLKTGDYPAAVAATIAFMLEERTLSSEREEQELTRQTVEAASAYNALLKETSL